MAPERTWNEEDRWHVTASALRNLLIVAVAIAGSVSCAIWFLNHALAADIRSVLIDAWPVQGLLGGAVLALIYKLQSDTAGVKGLRRAQQHLLDETVTRKAGRLWALVVMIALPVLLARISDHFAQPSVEKLVLGSAMVFALLSTALCLYLPSMWNELRRFSSELVARQQREDRRQSQLDRLNGKQ